LVARVAVFIDYQNVYMSARGAFFRGSSSHVDGQIHPLALGRLLADGPTPTRTCEAVRVYRGMPSNERDSKGYSAAQRQTAIWNGLPRVTACTRALNYREPLHPKEKGIDVLLAVDFVLGAIRNEFDVGIVCSADTDLVPALEAVVAMKGPQVCEVATWKPSDGSPVHLLGVKGHVIRKHALSRQAFGLVADTTDYTERRRRR
jgi:uncharacterized LabA/DUF88 family protein